MGVYLGDGACDLTKMKCMGTSWVGLKNGVLGWPTQVGQGSVVDKVDDSSRADQGWQVRVGVLDSPKRGVSRGYRVWGSTTNRFGERVVSLKKSHS